MVEELADGAVVVELPYAGTSWLVREILRGAGDLSCSSPRRRARRSPKRSPPMPSDAVDGPIGPKCILGAWTSGDRANRRAQSGADDAGGDEHLSVRVGAMRGDRPGARGAGPPRGRPGRRRDRGGIGASSSPTATATTPTGAAAAAEAGRDPARRRRGARRPARDRDPRPRRRPRLPDDRRPGLLQRRPRPRRGLDLRPP